MGDDLAAASLCTAELAGGTAALRVGPSRSPMPAAARGSTCQAAPTSSLPVSYSSAPPPIHRRSRKRRVSCRLMLRGEQIALQIFRLRHLRVRSRPTVGGAFVRSATPPEEILPLGLTDSRGQPDTRPIGQVGNPANQGGLPPQEQRPTCPQRAGRDRTSKRARPHHPGQWLCLHSQATLCGRDVPATYAPARRWARRLSGSTPTDHAVNLSLQRSAPRC